MLRIKRGMAGRKRREGRFDGKEMLQEGKFGEKWKDKFERGKTSKGIVLYL